LDELKEQAVAFVGDRLVAMADAVVPVWDLGFQQGITITERLRTFRRVPWKVAEHLERMQRGLGDCGIEYSPGMDFVIQVMDRVMEHNGRLLGPDDEQSVSVGITAGDLTAQSPAAWGQNSAHSMSGPRLVVTSVRLPVEQFVRKYQTGSHAWIVQTRDIPGATIPRHIKARSRLHYWLAQREAEQNEPGSQAILLDEEGYVSEATIATVALVDVVSRQVIIPPEDRVLPGTSIESMIPVFEHCNIGLERRPFRPEDLMASAEVVSFGTSPVILPVTRINGRPIGNGVPGEIFHELYRGFESYYHESLTAGARP
jgi:branched-subunit amino acid aminotransferase/4-amino-4-deoxychorismate lyase